MQQFITDLGGSLRSIEGLHTMNMLWEFFAAPGIIQRQLYEVLLLFIFSSSADTERSLRCLNGPKQWLST